MQGCRLRRPSPQVSPRLRASEPERMATSFGRHRPRSRGADRVDRDRGRARVIGERISVGATRGRNLLFRLVGRGRRRSGPGTLPGTTFREVTPRTGGNGERVGGDRALRRRRRSRTSTATAARTLRARRRREDLGAPGSHSRQVLSTHSLVLFARQLPRSRLRRHRRRRQSRRVRTSPGEDRLRARSRADGFESPRTWFAAGSDAGEAHSPRIAGALSLADVDGDGQRRPLRLGGRRRWRRLLRLVGAAASRQAVPRKAPRDESRR